MQVDIFEDSFLRLPLGVKTFIPPAWRSNLIPTVVSQTLCALGHCGGFARLPCSYEHHHDTVISGIERKLSKIGPTLCTFAEKPDTQEVYSMLVE